MAERPGGTSWAGVLITVRNEIALSSVRIKSLSAYLDGNQVSDRFEMEGLREQIDQRQSFDFVL